MVEFGYALSSEEHPPNDLVDYAATAEAAGFNFGMISDHYHPWVDQQGHSPFVWTVIGGIARATKTFRLGTGVTCPTIRIHPAVIAQAAATSAAMMPGRFFLGVGTGENLNEHILGGRWPSATVRREMLTEAIEVMRLLWQGGYQSHEGKHYTVENARIYTLPDRPIPIMFAASGPKAAEAAGESGDGLISTSPDKEVIAKFVSAGGGNKPRYGGLVVCWAADEGEAKKIAHKWWPNAAIKGELGQELPLPKHFEQAAEMVSEDDVAEAVVCGPDPQSHMDKLREYLEAGFDHIYIHQVGPDQRGFIDFYSSQVLPKLR